MLEELFQKAEINDMCVSERMKVYESSFTFLKEKAPNYNYFDDILQAVSSRDKIKIVLENENEEIYSLLENDEDSYTRYIDHTLAEESIKVRIKIEKEVKNNSLSVYNYDEFIKDILSLSIENVMLAFSNLLKHQLNYLIFDIYSTSTMFATKTMYFIPHGNRMIGIDFNRNQRIESCKEVSYFYNFDIYEIIPDDFKITIDYENNPLTSLFHQIMAILSINFIATSSSIDGKFLKGIINGQRTIEYHCEITDLQDNTTLYTIYNWIYTDGNPVDKAIIARNVISLHCKYVAISEIDEKVMSSIQSNYNLYLRENVKEYLDLKNKLAEFISNTVSKTGEYAMSLLNKFKSNIIAIFGFMFTVILANIVSDQPLNNIFTKEITALMECVILGSFVYLLICYMQSRYEVKRVYESYEQLKRNYDEILTEMDLREIFKDDEILKNMKEQINKSERRYLIIWIVFLLALLIVVELLSVSPTYKIIGEYIKKILNSLSVWIN